MSRLKGQAIPGWDGYRVTRGGRVYSTRRGGCRELAPEWSHRLDGPRGQRAHLRVGLYDGSGTRQWVFVHVLVALTHIGPRPTAAHQVCHRNGRRTDNRASNLYYGTASDNARDRERHARCA